MSTDKIKKYVLPNLPYLLIFWFGNRLGEAYRLAVGGNMLQKIGGISKTLNAALASPLPSFHPQDLVFGLAAAGIIYAVVYFKKKNATAWSMVRRVGAMPRTSSLMSIPSPKTTSS